MEFISVHIPQTVIKMLADEDNLNSAHEVPVLREGIINNTRLFNALYRFATSAGMEWGMDEEQELILLCGELLETPAKLQRADEQKINVVIEYLRDHLSVKPKLEMLAQLAGMSKYHLVRFFTRHTGMPPLQYHMQLRLHHALTCFAETCIRSMRR